MTGANLKLSLLIFTWTLASSLLKSACIQKKVISRNEIIIIVNINREIEVKKMKEKNKGRI